MMFLRFTTSPQLRLDSGGRRLAKCSPIELWLVLLSVVACRAGDMHGAGSPCDRSSGCRGPLQCIDGRCELPQPSSSGAGNSGAANSGAANSGAAGSGAAGSGSSGAASSVAQVGNSTVTDAGPNAAGGATILSIVGTSGSSDALPTETGAGPSKHVGTLPGAGGRSGTNELPNAAGETSDANLGGAQATGVAVAGAATARGGGAGNAQLPPFKSANGERCADGADCLSTHCVDRICCEAGCTEQCKACDLTGQEGKCVALQSGQPRGERPPCTSAGTACGGLCSGADSCSYPDASKICDRTSSCIDTVTRREAMACDGRGACLTPIDKACAPPNVCNINTDGDCGPAVYTHVVAYYFNTCAVVSDGTLRCWGDNEFGQLGLVGVEPRLVPYLVPSQKNVRSVAIGYQFVCALLRDGQVNCWGTNFHGQLGCQAPVLYDDRQQCVAYPPGPNVVELIGNGETPCARLRDGTVQCWGRNDYGAVGDGTVGTSRFEPTTVRGVANAIGISSGPWHACAVTAQGSVKCWGSNDWGQLGNGTTTSISVASMVKGIDGVAARAVEVAAYGVQTCVVLADGSMQCFGRNDHGELGNGETTNRTLPVAAQAPMTAVKVAVGGHFTCAMIDPTSLKCWGAGKEGQLGNGAFADSLLPVALGLPHGIEFKELVASDLHGCALSTTGRLWCWGGNSAGQLGLGTLSPSGVPVEVAAP